MSTTIEIDLMPASFSRLTIHTGVCAFASKPEAERTTNFDDPALPLIGALSETFTSKPSARTGLTRLTGSVNLAPVACENSLAIPLIEKQ